MRYLLVVVIWLVIVGGMWAISRQPPQETRDAFRPFFSLGMLGLLQAMGYTFIALQGFDLIAAAGGGIVRSVEATRAASVEELAEGVEGRLDEMLLCGTTTAEVKSGSTAPSKLCSLPRARVVCLWNAILRMPRLD